MRRDRPCDPKGRYALPPWTDVWRFRGKYHGSKSWSQVYHLVPGETLCIPMAMGKMPEMPGSEHMSSPGSMPGQESDRPGWDVIIPYTVREGESLNSLLETFHMDFSDFEKLNPELMPILLTPGEKVYVKRNRTVVMEEQ